MSNASSNQAAPALAVVPCSAPKEYLRRNIVVAKACGLKAEVGITLLKLQNRRRVPKWLLASLAAMRGRAADLPSELAQWRDASPDNPYSRNTQLCRCAAE